MGAGQQRRAGLPVHPPPRAGLHSTALQLHSCSPLAVQDVVEPLMESYRPPGIIKRIFFEEFTFGDAPFRVEGIAVRQLEDEIDLEVDVRW